MKIGAITTKNNSFYKCMVGIACSLLLFSAVSVPVLAAVTVNNLSNEIPAQNAGVAWTTLNTIIIKETASTDIPANQSNVTLILTVPSGFELNTSASPVFAPSATNGDIISYSASVSSNKITLVFSTDNNANKTDTLNLSNIQIRPLSGEYYASGNIYADSASTATISGVTKGVGGTSFASLSEYIDDLEITTISLDEGRVNEDYSYYLAAIGGIEPYSWAIIYSSLPADLDLSSEGEIYGMPAAEAEVVDIKFEVTDALGTAVQSEFLTLTIQPEDEDEDETYTSNTLVARGIDYLKITPDSTDGLLVLDISSTFGDITESRTYQMILRNSD